MKPISVTVRLPAPLVARLDAKSQLRGISRSDLIRERLEREEEGQGPEIDPLASIRDLIGSVDGGRPDLSSRKKEYLRAMIDARKRGR